MGLVNRSGEPVALIGARGRTPHRAPVVFALCLAAALTAGITRVGTAAAGMALPLASAGTAPTVDILAEVRSLVVQGDMAGAERLARDRFAELGGEDAAPSPEIADAWEALSLALIKSAPSSDECRRATRTTIELRAMLDGEESEPYARALSRRGDRLLASHAFEDAREAYEQALEIQARAATADSPGASEIRKRLASVYGELGLDREALALGRREIDLAEARGPEGRADLVPLLYNHASTLQRVGELAEAEQTYRRAITLAEQEHGPEHLIVAYLANGLGILYAETLHDYTKARPCYERALAIAETIPPDHPFRASCLNNLGLLLQDIGDYEEAQLVYERALAAHVEARGEADPYTASTLANVANVALLAGDLARARELHERALRIREETLGEAHPEVATSLRALGEVALREGNAGEALDYFARCHEIRSAHSGSDHHETGEALADLSRAREAQGELAAARAGYAAAKLVLEARLGRHDPRVAGAELGLARLELADGNESGARAHSLYAEEISRRHARVMAAGLPERQALRLAATRTEALDLALSLLDTESSDDAIAQTWESLIRSRALVLDTILARRARLEDPALRELAGVVADRAREHADLLVQGPVPGEEREHAGRIREARRRHEEAELRLIEASGRPPAGRTGSGWTDVRAALPRDAGLIAYARFDPARSAVVPAESRPEYVAFAAVPGDPSPRAVRLGAADPIERAVRAWRAAVSSPSVPITQVRSVAAELRRLVWDPIAPALGEADLLFVVPDGDLHRVSFATLPAGGAAGSAFLLETGPALRYLTAERDVVGPTAPPPRGEGLLVLGGPRFSRAAEPAESPFRALPAAAGEASSIADVWRGRGASGVVELIDLAATEEAFKANASGKRVIHLATHGFFSGLPEPASGTRGIGGVGSGGTVKGARPARRLPVDLCGLALAGANDVDGEGAYGEDGILTAGEIAALDLRGTEWAVLSACDTGIGTVQETEGVLGLRRAFEVAGVETIVMSLWSVDDAATRTWMESLYETRFVDEERTADAVRSAALRLLNAGRVSGSFDHPFYWGGFVAAGRRE